jgi:two-component system KDP operon response regulator KdpE
MAVRIGQYTVDLAARIIRADDGSEIRLTPTEWHVLEVLARNPAS